MNKQNQSIITDQKHWPTSYISNIGGRENNQDDCDFAQQENHGCWIVADGLGGHSGGQEASKLAVKTILAAYAENQQFSKDALYHYFSLAQLALQEQQSTKPEFSDMRTTVVLLLRQKEQVWWGHVGDSRLYHFRNGQIIFQTKDHSVPQMLVAAEEIEPEQIRNHSDRNRLLRSVGEPGEVSATYLKEPIYVQLNDAFLLCTDGFWEYVLESEMESDLSQATDPGNWLALMEQCLLGKGTGNFDNYTALAVWVK